MSDFSKLEYSPTAAAANWGRGPIIGSLEDHVQESLAIHLGERK